MAGSILGHDVLRREDDALVRGQGTYVANLDFDNPAVAVFVRSTMAHARILSIDTDDAVAQPGVLAILTGDDLDLPRAPLPMEIFPNHLMQPLLADGTVRYVGEPVAVIIAESLSAGADAAELVIVDYDPLEPIIDPLTAADAPPMFAEHDRNVALEVPAVPIDWEECEVVIEQVMVNQRVAACPIEGRVAAAQWNGDMLTQNASCQGSHAVQNLLSMVYGIDAEQIRVITRDVGGGFGAKGFPSPEELLIPELARRVGRPVVWAESRSENMVAMSHGRAQYQTVKVGGGRDGKITHFGFKVVQDSGAYPKWGAMLPTGTMRMASGVYEVPNIEFEISSVLTTTTPINAYRGAGRPEAAAAIERALDVFAAEIAMDPAELRRRNYIDPDAFPYETPTGARYDSGEYEAGLDRVLEAARYDDLRAEQAQRRATGDRLQLGIGLASYVEVTAGGGGGSEFGAVAVQPDGRVLVRTGSTPYGQGHQTTWAMIVADKLGIDMDLIDVVYGDTDFIPHSGVTGGSRSVQIAGSAIRDASGRLVEMARDRAADLLEASIDDIVIADGSFHVAGTPAKSLSWTDLVTDGPMEAQGDFVQAHETYPFGTHLCVVEVDTETGHVKIRQLIALDDAGVLINPMIATGQVHGGLAQGAAQALLEEMRYDEDGNPLTSNFADYTVISATELPMFERLIMETPTPENPIGAKGIGESGTVGSTPAVQNAVIDAVAHLGVRHIDMPCTPERVWNALAAAG